MGCNKKPIHGLRFKCKDCPDYDLCAECFANKSSIHCGENAAREFETITFPQASCAWPAFCKGKGKGKCKGKGKGKGKWWFQGSEETPESADCLRPCAREGCKFAATWHATHCCGACANNKGVHGGRCERKVIETATEEAPSAEPAPELKPEPTPEPTAELTQDPSPTPTTEPKQDSNDSVKAQMRACARKGCKFAATWHPTHCCAACANKGAHGGRCERKVIESTPAEMAAVHTQDATEVDNTPSPPISQATTAIEKFEFCFPVEIADGRRATISWNAGDDVSKVVNDFAHEHGIMQDELPAIQAFVEHANAVHQQATTEATPEKLDEACFEADLDAKATTKYEEPAPAEDDELVKSAQHLQEMGLGSADVILELLKANGGSVQRTLETLLAQQ